MNLFIIVVVILITVSLPFVIKKHMQEISCYTKNHQIFFANKKRVLYGYYISLIGIIGFLITSVLVIYTGGQNLSIKFISFIFFIIHIIAEHLVIPKILRNEIRKLVDQR
ncbi:hypothetical protein [Priestia taiwanensis]|uniref:Uncharacterized protein n=1 Tax=Priestia taiwanensis TaxID=1347902 RepID=A0A917ALL3_9BACI|nr:hypothetical protein [Priestia taiwanensis]MBM7362254.1 preprotein translocase subunit Sss1 [Priestia taiwanensis]GGE60678.1 hypothetical protein GCM10007140_08750 [Priestia taiwanensis]